MCELPLPAQYQTEENQKLMQKLDLQAEENQKLREKLDHMINIQIQTSQQINKLKDIILQVSGVSQAAYAAIPGPSIDDGQSIDSLLADDDGQDMEQEETRTQHPEQNVAQVFEVDGALPPPAVDILHAAVDQLMVDSDMQNQKQDSLECMKI